MDLTDVLGEEGDLNFFLSFFDVGPTHVKKESVCEFLFLLCCVCVVFFFLVVCSFVYRGPQMLIFKKKECTDVYV